MLVQAMAEEGVEVLCGAVQDEVSGAVVISGAGGVDAGALADRAARPAADHPEITELDLNPAIVLSDGVTAVDARVRLTSRRDWDPCLRRLR